MASFKGTDWISLQKRSSDNIYRFRFDAASSEDGRGAIPYGLTVSSASVSATNDDTGADVTSTMITTPPAVSGNTVVNLGLTWAGAGNFKLTFALTLSDNSIWEFDYDRVLAEDL